MPAAVIRCQARWRRGTSAPARAVVAGSRLDEFARLARQNQRTHLPGRAFPMTEPPGTPDRSAARRARTARRPVLLDRQALLAACTDIRQTCQSSGFGPAMAKLIVPAGYRGLVPADYRYRPRSEPGCVRAARGGRWPGGRPACPARTCRATSPMTTTSARCARHRPAPC
jgi:hypothetical protein